MVKVEEKQVFKKSETETKEYGFIKLVRCSNIDQEVIRNQRVCTCALGSDLLKQSLSGWKGSVASESWKENSVDNSVDIVC